MELWIRSQDKLALRKCSDLIITDETNETRPSNIKNANFNWVIQNDYEPLGRYATKERTLEVLDEVNRHIESLYNHKFNIDDDTIEQFTYQMPEV